jgi:predicted metal-dependent hydrolase
MRIALKRSPEQLVARVAGRKLAVLVKRNARARRMILRIDESLGIPVITLPNRTALAKGEDFLRQNLGWLESRLDRMAPGVPFCDGSVFPLRGAPCRIVHRGGRGVVGLEKRASGWVLLVPGEADFVHRRITEWVKREARHDLERAVAWYTRHVGRRETHIRVADPKSRWGSCSSTGVLTFSWRLVLAPPFVLDYLAAHEVAHLREMNHGPRFWALLERLEPDYEFARDWLTREGPKLSAIGRPPGSGFW